MVYRINSLLDGSLFTDNSYKETFSMVNNTSEIDYRVSHTFYELAVNHQITDEPAVREFFSSYDSFYDSEEAGEVLRESEVEPFDGRQYADDYYEYYGQIQSETSNENNLLTDILFDEFMFSLTQSPILSRLKKTAEQFKSSVAYSIEISEQRLRRDWENLQSGIGHRIDSYEEFNDLLEERAQSRLDLDYDDPVLLSTYLRQIVKDYSPNWMIHIVDSYVTSIAGTLVGGAIAGPVGSFAGAVTPPLIGDAVMYLADP